MDGVTQQNATLVQQAMAAIASLEEQAQQLTKAVEVFHLGSEYQTAASRTRPAGNMALKRPALSGMAPALPPARTASDEGSWEKF
ncbi:Methyl-accepting chemotaxis protein III [Dickeya solani]|nr:Methyl-accepting chemotaxis protein III [Dickeya solani]